ncbi:MAG: radical SAM protein [Gemmatimonadota bacterium]
MRRLLRIFGEPVPAEIRATLARARARVPERYRSARQWLGRSGAGCGATIGAMPRCDFACRGCYLGRGANRIPPLPVEAVKAQMRTLRPSLGDPGNLQLTDGEVLLRPTEEVTELLRYAREIGLMPMLMTHGDAFRRRPGLLERLIVEGGLEEVGIHVDTTQRGRFGAAFRDARREKALDPLRDELAGTIRAARRATKRPLRAAMTVTVTAENLGGVAGILRWLKRNADVFRIVSFQPLAAVGRTEPGLLGVAVEDLWREIAAGLLGPGADSSGLAEGVVWMGHPKCNRILPGLVARDGSAEPVFHPLRRDGDALDERVVDGFIERFGRLTFRGDSRSERIARIAGAFAAAPGFALRSAPPYAARWLRRLAPGGRLRFLLRLLRGRASVSQLTVVSHHFMSREEALSAEGRERRELCVFRVAVDGRLVSMCEANALGVRERVYAEAAGSSAPGLGSCAEEGAETADRGLRVPAR